MHIQITKPENYYFVIPKLDKNFIKESKSGNYVGCKNGKISLPYTENMLNSVLSLTLYFIPTKSELEFLKDKLRLTFKSLR